MVKLDAQVLRYMSREEFRVLTALEMGMKNHEIVPTTLIARIAGMKSSMVNKLINNLHRNKLIRHDAQKYDGYKLTYAGYDYLALRTLLVRGHITGVGRRIGVGKEADVYEVCNEQGESMILKIHRLGRICFRNVKNKRDYLLHRKNASWLYMSRLAALREFAYMRALYDHGFPTPTPIDHNRHVILMSYVHAYPFGNVRKLNNPSSVYNNLMNLIIRLAEHGLIHCDFNEFNLLIDDDEVVTLIDFPQMVSTSHINAAHYFDRDVTCIQTYFHKRFGFECGEKPIFRIDTETKIELDKQIQASGANVTEEQEQEFDRFITSKNDGEYDDDDDIDTDDEDEGNQYSDEIDSHVDVAEDEIDAMAAAVEKSVANDDKEDDNDDDNISISSKQQEKYAKKDARRAREQMKQERRLKQLAEKEKVASTSTSTPVTTSTTSTTTSTSTTTTTSTSTPPESNSAEEDSVEEEEQDDTTSTSQQIQPAIRIRVRKQLNSRHTNHVKIHSNNNKHKDGRRLKTQIKEER